MAVSILGMVPMTYELGKKCLDVGRGRCELRQNMEELEGKVEGMKKQVMEEEKLGKRRYNSIDAYFRQVKQFKVSAERVLEESREGQWKVKRVMWVPCIERHCREGQELLIRGRKLQKEGLTYDEGIRTRGGILPVVEDQYLGEKVTDFMDSAVRAMKNDRARCIGIYGYAGSGKTNLMKHLYNRIHQDNDFEAVYWATAPDMDTCARGSGSCYNKALQKCVADGMRLDLENNVVHDEVRCASRILARLSEIGSPGGRAVVFLDNVKKEFFAYDLLGIPSLLSSGVASVNCILVFSTLSKDVCNRMQCDLTHKMDLLETKEAEELFLHEVKRGDNDQQVLNQGQERIQNIAIKVANECAGMQLAIIVISRAMASNIDLQEWRHRLNELKGIFSSSIYEEEKKILSQLKFGYYSLKDRTVKSCFLEAAILLADVSQVLKQDIINRWMECRLIDATSDDQGYTVLNQLERMCLLQFAPDHQTVTMNKWICKMATEVRNSPTPLDQNQI